MSTYIKKANILYKKIYHRQLTIMLFIPTGVIPGHMQILSVSKLWFSPISLQTPSLSSQESNDNFFNILHFDNKVSKSEIQIVIDLVMVPKYNVLKLISKLF